MPRACRQALGTTASTTNGTQGPRAAIVAFGSLICVHLRNLWMARIGLLWLRLGRARPSAVNPNETCRYESRSGFSLTGSGKKEIVFGGPAAIFAHPFSKGALAQSVRALPCHGRGCGFESRRLRHSFPGGNRLSIRVNKGDAVSFCFPRPRSIQVQAETSAKSYRVSGWVPIDDRVGRRWCQPPLLLGTNIRGLTFGSGTGPHSGRSFSRPSSDAANRRG